MPDLLGISACHMLQALADGETDPAALATLAASHWRTPWSSGAMPSTCVSRCIPSTNACSRSPRKTIYSPHTTTRCSLAEVPGLGADSAQQIIPRAFHHGLLG
jgi:hypothetical protein